MLYPKNAKKFDLELFKNPTAEYRATPFWAWNTDLSRDILFREIEYMKKMGFGGFHMHSRVGMSTEYLSDDFMALIKDCNEKAKEENMLSWLYDEDKWPSGFAGGLVTKKHENRMKYVLFTKTPYVDGEKAILSSHSTGNIDNRSGNGTLLARYDIKLDEEGYLASYKRLEDGEDGEDVFYLYVESSSEKAWFNFQTYVDTLSKSAIDDFINITHERYLEVLGDEFGKSVPAIFTDEPQVTRKTCLDFSTESKDVFLPYTTDFDDTYKATYGVSVLDTFPEIVYEKREVSVARYRYHDHVTERFVEAFADNIGAWCKKNGILLTGHMMEEPTLESQTAAIGEAMRSYRSFTLPGIDILCDHREFTTLKQAASAAHQYGAPGVMSELYGVTGWDFDFRGHKLQGDWQAALGVSVRVPHLYWVSMGGEAKRDYPASIGHQSSWYKEYSYIEDHFARVNTLMTRGKPSVKVGVIHPIESYWLHFGPKDKTSAKRIELDKKFAEITEWLLLGTIDFDFISESLLPQQFDKNSDGFTIGEMKYDAIVIPSLETIRSTTLSALENFINRGGKVINMGDMPTYVDAMPSNKPKKVLSGSESISWNKTALLSSLEAQRSISILNERGVRADNFVYGERVEGDKKYLFICHAFEHSRLCVPDVKKHTITIRGEYVPTLMNTENGMTEDMAAIYRNGNTEIIWKAYPHSSLLLALTPGRSTAIAKEEVALGEMSYLDTECELILDEPNVLVLDMMEWSVNGGEWNKADESLKVCHAAKNKLNLSSALMDGAQPWAFEKPKPENTISLRISFNSDIEIADAELALEDLEISDVTFNGVPVKKNCTGIYVDFSIKKIRLEKIVKGKNEIIITKPFGAVSTVENVFVLGDFGTEVIGSHAKIVAPKKTVRYGDIVPQGLAFYGGKLTYRIKLDGGYDTSLALGVYLASCVTIDLDGEPLGNVSLSPSTVHLGKLTEGEHVLDIHVYASRHNTFGYLHNCDDTTTWYGPNAWHTTGGNYSYEYILKKVGLLTAPRIFKK